MKQNFTRRYIKGALGMHWMQDTTGWNVHFLAHNVRQLVLFFDHDFET